MNPMPRRKYIVVFGMALFFLSIWSMWSVMDVEQFSSVSRSSELINLKGQVQTIEHHLEENKIAMVKLRNSFQDLLRLSQLDNLQANEQKVLVNQIMERKSHDVVQARQNYTYYKDDGFTCQNLKHETLHVDVNMADVYERLPFDDQDGGVWKQGFPIETNDNEWKNKKLRVFVVPHSHNDPGWIKTYEKYFMDQTRHILDNVVDGLAKDSKRRFIWAEISYLSKWFDIADDGRKAKAKELIKNGQLEIVTGGWVMNDEANTHIYAMVDQMIEGHDWISRELEVKPRSGWAIDPFGHTPTMAYILKKMQFENMLIQRVHYHIKKHFSQIKALEFRWRQGWDSDASSEMLCHMMPFYSYDIPHTCGPDPKICCQFDFARLPGTKINCPWKVPPQAITSNNVAERSRLLLDQYRKKSKLFKSDTLLVILGDDFRYGSQKEMEAQFTNYAAIFEHVNSHPEYNAELRFGTLSEYFDAMKTSIDQSTLPSLSGDFFTYNDRIDNFWSGYYTSRPYYKQQDRKLEAHLRGAEIIYSLAVAKSGETERDLINSLFKKLVDARQNLGLFQHHDGITGTAKDLVVNDYGIKLRQSIMDTKEITTRSAQMLLAKDSSSATSEDYKFNLDAIMATQDLMEQKTVIKLDTNGKIISHVVVYNSLAYERKAMVRVHINCVEAMIKSSDGTTIPSQVNLIWTKDSASLSDVFELVFIASVPASGLTTYMLSCMQISTFNTLSNVEIRNAPVTESHAESRGQFLITQKSKTDKSDSDFTIENEHLLLKFSSTNGLLQSAVTKRDEKLIKLNLDFGIYTAKVGKDKPGAYLFLPTGPSVPYATDSMQPLIRVIQGPLINEVHVLFPHIEHRVSLHTMNSEGTSSLGIQVNNIVDVRSGMDNKELSMRLHTDSIQSGDIFYTDLNGFQIHRRKTFHDKLPIQGNFYPMPSMAYIQDTQTRLSILSGQPLGVASLSSGSLEVIMDRRLMQDDSRGLFQPVKDNRLTPNSFVILIEKWNENVHLDEETISYPSLVAHHSLIELLYPLTTMHRHVNSGFETEFKPLAGDIEHQLPCDVHLFNLRSIRSKTSLEPTEESGLILQRLGQDCRFDSGNYYKATCKKKTDTSDLKIELLYSIGNIAESSLSLMSTGDSLPLDSFITIEPMEINAYKISLRFK